MSNHENAFISAQYAAESDNNFGNETLDASDIPSLLLSITCELQTIGRLLARLASRIDRSAEDEDGAS